MSPPTPMKQVMCYLKTRGHLCPQGAPIPIGSTSAHREHLCHKEHPYSQGVPLPTGSIYIYREHLCQRGVPLPQGAPLPTRNISLVSQSVEEKMGMDPTPILAQGSSGACPFFSWQRKCKGSRHRARLGSSQSCGSSEGADFGVNSRWKTLPSPPANSFVSAVVSQMQKERATT